MGAYLPIKPSNRWWKHDVIVIGSSAGGIEALREIVRDLPPDMQASVFVVQHTSPMVKSLLDRILSRAAKLPVDFPDDGEKIESGHVYVAPADRHLMLEDHRIIVTSAPKENNHRPAINPLFRSAAHAYGKRVIGVVLTGLLDDGTAGLWEIKRLGGIAIVQSPEDAAYPQMPRNALANVDVDYVVPLGEIAGLLVKLCKCEE